jgi:hypothetical protein
MQTPVERRRLGSVTQKTLVSLILVCGGLVGCGGGGLTEADVLSRLEAAGLTVERLDENLLTNAQRQRIEHPMETVYSVQVSDGEGNGQAMTFIQFDRDFMAESAGYEGVPGFQVRNWYFAGVVQSPEIRSAIEAALQ